jgi:hypothetical protein
MKIAWSRLDYRKGVVVPPYAFPSNVPVVTASACRHTLSWRRQMLSTD